MDTIDQTPRWKKEADRRNELCRASIAAFERGDFNAQRELDAVLDRDDENSEREYERDLVCANFQLKKTLIEVRYLIASGRVDAGAKLWGKAQADHMDNMQRASIASSERRGSDPSLFTSWFEGREYGTE